MSSDASKDYYAVLGLLPDADPELIKAAYRALAKKYHPDTGSGDKKSNAQKFLEIQDAYDVLNDPERRRQHDRERKKSDQAKDSFSAEQNSADVEIDPDEQWEKLVRAQPEIDKIFNEFRQISHALANSFQLSVIGASNPNTYRKIATELEGRFLSKYFSDHAELQNLAKRLLLRGRRNAARKLNDVIKTTHPLNSQKRRVILADFERRYLGQESQWRKAERRTKNASTATPKPTSGRTWLLGSAAVLALGALVFVGLGTRDNTSSQSEQSSNEGSASNAFKAPAPQQNSSESVHSRSPDNGSAGSLTRGTEVPLGRQEQQSGRKLIYERLVTNVTPSPDQNSTATQKVVEESVAGPDAKSNDTAPDGSERGFPTPRIDALTYEESAQSSEASKPAVERIKPSPGLTLSGGGSAFRVNARGDAVTAYHVVETCEEMILNGKSTSEKMKLAHFDAEHDLAVLQLYGKVAGYSKFARFSSLENGALGERVIVLGFPLADILGDALRISDGLISSLDSFRSDTTRFQISAPVQPGNSGGPVLDESGRVIGVASDILDGQQINTPVQNVNFAIKGSVVQEFLGQHDISISLQEGSGLDTAEIIAMYDDVVLQISCYTSRDAGGASNSD